MRFYTPSGKLFFKWSGEQPFLFLGAKGTVLDFKAGDKRKNYVIYLKDQNFFKLAKDPGKVEFSYDGNNLLLPAMAFIEESWVNEWERRFQTVLDIWLQPIPINRFRVECGVLGLLYHILNEMNPGVDSLLRPEWKLKDLIDKDRSSRHNISELSEKCGYSSDYLRILFQKSFGISPVAYRQKQRMNYAMSLIISSDLTVRDISYDTGFRHETHFCTAFKSEYKITPFEAIKKHRFRKRNFEI